MKRIIHLLPSITPRSGGLYNSVYGLAEADYKNGADVYILSGWEANSISHKKRWQKFNLRLVPKIPPYKLSFMPLLVTSLLIIKPNSIHIHGIWSYHAFAALIYKSIMPSTKLIVSPRGMCSEYSLTRSSKVKKILRFLYVDKLLSNSDYIHVLSKNEGLEVATHFNRSHDLLLQPNVLNSDFKKSIDSIKTVGVKESKKFTLGFIGRLHPKKNIESIINILPSLSIEYHLKIYGSGDTLYIKQLEELASNLEVTNRVNFMGHISGKEKAKALKSMDIFILNSYSEGVPMAVIEALYAGRPTIISKNCNLDSLSPIKNLKIIDGSEEELQKAILQLSNSDMVNKENNSILILREKGLLEYNKKFLNSRL